MRHLDQDRYAKVLEYIKSYKADHDGVAPTLREIIDATGTNSTSYTQFVLRQLEKEGKISVMWNTSRGIMVTGGQWTASPDTASHS